MPTRNACMVVIKVAVVRAFKIALAATGMLTACSGSPAIPTLGSQSLIPVGTLIEIVGPEVVTLGATVQFTVVAQLPHGSTRDVTNDARWSESVGALLSFSAPGVVTARERGETQLFIEIDRYQKRKDVMVLPANTYRLAGRVAEADASERWISGARVEVTAGVEVPLVVHTDGAGQYRVYGVAGETTLRVTRDGYQPIEQAVVVANHHTFNVGLPLLSPRPNVAGTYTLTITASSQCRVGVGEGAVPEELRVRSYSATVEQAGPSVWMTLSAPAFTDDSRPTFPGSLEPGKAAFVLRELEENAPLIEWLTDSSTILEIDGQALAAVSPSRLAGTLGGTYRVFEGRYGGVPIARCLSTNHQFVMSR